MKTRASMLTTLPQLPMGVEARISEIHGGRTMTRRLLSLGLRIGSRIQVIQHRGRGVVVACEGNRVALGGGVADRILTQSPQQHPAG